MNFCELLQFRSGKLVRNNVLKYAVSLLTTECQSHVCADRVKYYPVLLPRYWCNELRLPEFHLEGFVNFSACKKRRVHQMKKKIILHCISLKLLLCSLDPHLTLLNFSVLSFAFISGLSNNQPSGKFCEQAFSVSIFVKPQFSLLA